MAGVGDEQIQLVYFCLKFHNKNHSKNVSENDLQALVDFAICNPGEYASLGYWINAIHQGISIKCTPENMRLIWMNYIKNKHLKIEPCLSINILPKKNTIENSIIIEKNMKNLFICSISKKRKIYDMNELSQMAIKYKINEKFEKFLQKIKQIIKIHITSKEILSLLTIHKGKTKDVLIELITKYIEIEEIISVYQEYCKASNEQIPYDAFLTIYIKNNGIMRSVHNFLSKNDCIIYYNKNIL